MTKNGKKIQKHLEELRHELLLKSHTQKNPNVGNWGII